LPRGKSGPADKSPEARRDAVLNKLALRDPRTWWLVAGVAWLAFAAFDFYDARFFRGLVALVLAVGAFIASRYARRTRA
jgi:hypothetical protein